MSVEQRTGIPGRTEEIKRGNFIQSSANEIGQNTVRWFTENVAISTPAEYHQDYLADYLAAVKAGYIPAFIGNHTAQFNAIQMSYVTREAIGLANEYLPEDMQLKGAVMPFAKSMETGSQGKLAGFFYDSIKPLLARNGIVSVYTATQNDKVRRGEETNSIGFVGTMTAKMRNGYAAVAVFPEASVEGGKKGPEGKRKGMQPFVDGSSATLLALAMKLRRPGVVFIPVGFTGSEKINSASTRWPTLEGFRAGFLMEKGVCTTKVGKPIRSDEPDIQKFVQKESRDLKALDNRLGHAIAELLPEDLRGVYA